MPASKLILPSSPRGALPTRGPFRSFGAAPVVPRGPASGALAARPVLPEGSGAPSQFTTDFAFQSFFDTTKQEKGILSQPVGSPIVPSTLTSADLPGYSVGLHPSSQTPVTIKFRLSGQQSGSQPYVLKPGHIIRPFGLPPGAKYGAFVGFDYGLPFGWLGGGLATLVVFPSADAEANWPGNTEVIFHRMSMPITSTAALTLLPNWPLRFPWANAYFGGSTNVPQFGAPTIAIANPTKIILRLRATSALGAANKMRLMFFNSDDFDKSSTGTFPASPTTPAYLDVTWAAFAASGATVGGTNVTEYPTQTITEFPSRIGGDQCKVIAFDMTGSLNGLFLDVERLGVL